MTPPQLPQEDLELIKYAKKLGMAKDISFLLIISRLQSALAIAVRQRDRLYQEDVFIDDDNAEIQAALEGREG